MRWWPPGGSNPDLWIKSLLEDCRLEELHAV
jgi:hypothetical protein